MTRLHVEHPGGSALVEDLGRPGLAHLGVAASGALDRAALALANRLVGNPDGAAALELLVGGFRARFEGDAWFAVAGAWGPVSLDGHPVPPYTAARARDGAVLEIGMAASGIRLRARRARRRRGARRAGIAVEGHARRARTRSRGRRPGAGDRRGARGIRAHRRPGRRLPAAGGCGHARAPARSPCRLVHGCRARRALRVAMAADPSTPTGSAPGSWGPRSSDAAPASSRARGPCPDRCRSPATDSRRSCSPTAP